MEEGVTCNALNSNKRNIELRKLREKIEEKRALINRIQLAEELVSEQYYIKDNIEREFKDIKSGVISSFLLYFLKNKEKKLSEKKEECDTDRTRYDECLKKLNNAENEVQNYRRQLEEFGDIECVYRELLEKKREVLLKNNSQGADEIRRLLYEEQNYNNSIIKLNKSIIAGNNAMGALISLEGALNDAKSCSNWIVAGGGESVAEVRCSHLNEAKKIDFNVQDLLRDFQRELEDTHIQFSFANSACIGKLLENKINNSLKQTINTIRNVMMILWELENSITNIKEELDNLKDRIEEVIVNN